MAYIKHPVLFAICIAISAATPAPTPTPSPSPTPTPSPTPMTTTTSTALPTGGECIGNDSRCAGSSEGQCKQLKSQGSDCRWDKTSTGPDSTSKKPGSPTQGECIGNDSRCTGSSQTKCTQLANQGSDCQWEVSSPINTQGAGGNCLGNDSRCANSRHAKCIRLKKQGSSCRWERSTLSSASAGKCAGHDTRCDGKSKQSCAFLSQDGADCKWRKDFVATGSLTMTVTNASSFIENPNATVAIKEGISNVTAVPREYIDVDLYVSPDRRLRGRGLAQTGTVVATYVIVVGSDAPATVAVTGDEIGQILKASNSNQISAAITSKVKESFGSQGFDIVLAGVESVELAIISDNTNSTSANATNVTTTTTAGSSLLGDDGGALSTGLARSLVFAFVTSILFV